ncbi:MAG: 23S rRNA (pseudouridine(1915)-N(3))-methyltransferase RlmH [Candidatus Zeuxoniibacter abyssi]|nr:MAG: 23S rRNA (pseudouridine(1915)-N(3))-methyltransferase RlmH [Candidatus Persebacteraceae bacterium AB1(2)]
MKTVHLIVVARRAPEWLAALESDYIRRLALFSVQVSVVKPAETADKEAKALMAKLAKLPPDARMILLDEKGEAIDSAAFAKRLSLWLEDKTPPVFVICGANGASAQIRRSAAHKLSLSAMTFSHATARLVFVEQFFRADCILRGHPYPR